MARRIVVLGASGYTGRLVAEALVARGAAPLLAARSERPLEELASELGGLDTALADVSQPDSIRALIGEPGDVLVSTVGPFTRYGDPAVEAAAAAGAVYIDSTGEPPFIRRVFERFGPQAKVSGAALITAFGYDWVPGNLAGALALREAGERARRVEIGYFLLGGRLAPSGGTRASAAGALLEQAFAWRDGRLVSERAAKRTASFDVAGRRLTAISVGASEHFTLPRLHPELTEVDAYLGWFGPLSRALQAVSLVSEPLMRVPGARKGLQEAVARLVKGSSGGPPAEVRAKIRSFAIAAAFAAGGERLAEVRVEGIDPYTFTGRVIAWAAATAAESGVRASGAIGPAEAFGLDELTRGCAEAGLERV